MTAMATWKQQVVDSARVCRTDHKEIVSQFSESQRKMAKQLKKLGLSENWQAKQDAERKLRDLYYSRWVASIYPVVDMSFTVSRLDLLLRRTADGVQIIGAKDREPDAPQEHSVSVKRYAVQRDGDRTLFGALPNPQCQLGAFLFPQFQLNRERFKAFNGHVNCNRPEGYPASLRSRLRDIAALGLEAHAAAVRAGVSVGAATFSRAILWEPRVEDMYVTEQIPVRDDPAILVMSGDRAHLIGFWDSPTENLIEGVLREFSDGSFDSVSKPTSVVDEI